VREVRKDCQKKRRTRDKIPVKRGARKTAEVHCGFWPAFWKGKTSRTAEAILRGVSR
jgi:hypothetical protein